MRLESEALAEKERLKTEEAEKVATEAAALAKLERLEALKAEILR